MSGLRVKTEGEAEEDLAPLPPSEPPPPPSRLALHLLQDPPRPYVRTGCAALDAALGGGLARPGGGVVELYGEAGVGKTQLGFQLMLNLQRDVSQGGLDAGSVYLTTESGPHSVPFERVRDMMRSSEAANSAVDPLSRIVVASALTAVDLWLWVHDELPLLLASRRFRLVWLDSIASPFRVDFAFTKQGMTERSAYFFGLARTLKRLSHEFDCLIVCTNHVVSEAQGMRPALGPAWASCVNERLCLEFADEERTRRRLRIVFSPYRGSHVQASDLRVTKHAGLVGCREGSGEGCCEPRAEAPEM